MEKIKHAVIIMAGKGTRFLPATKAVAKELFPIGNKPALLFHLEECYNSGIEEVTIVISKQKKDVIKFLSEDKELETLLKGSNKEYLLADWKKVVSNLKINFVYQGKMNGNGGAVYSAKQYTKDKPFVILQGDDLCLTQENGVPATLDLIKTYEKTGKFVLGVKNVDKDKTDRYGIVTAGKKLSDKEVEVEGIVEKPKKGTEPSTLASLARYLVLPNIYENLKNGEKHANGEVYLSEAIGKEIAKGRVVACEFDATYYDLGNKLEFIKCTIENGLNDKDISGELRNYIKKLAL